MAQDYNDVHHSDILFYAARGNYPSIVNKLIPHIRKPAQNNPALYIAAEYGYLNIADILLNNGDPNEISNDGKPFQGLQWRSQITIMKLF